MLDQENAAAAEENAVAEPVAAEKGKGGVKKFSDEQIAEMRALRAENHPEGHAKAGKPVWSHKALAEKFGTAPGVVSHIVRNRVYKNPNYVPTNDGK